MPPSDFYDTKRTPYNVRHEVFYGTGLRPLSIKYGLVVFLSPENHNMGNFAVHSANGDALRRELERTAQRAAMKRYGWTAQDFINIFGRNCL